MRPRNGDPGRFGRSTASGRSGDSRFADLSWVVCVRARSCVRFAGDGGRWARYDTAPYLARMGGTEDAAYDATTFAFREELWESATEAAASHLSIRALGNPLAT